VAIVIVSGLPRSGTSLMMQMLAAGGMPILTDNLRKPDEHNPRGYLEYEPVKATKRDPGWVRQAEGKAVKVVYALLRGLPATHHYRVIMMHRDLDETIASQQTMLRQSGSAEKLKALFARDLQQTEAWLSEQANFEVLAIEHRNCLQNPAHAAKQVNTFAGGQLNEAAMAEAVDPSLYRQRA